MFFTNQEGDVAGIKKLLTDKLSSISAKKQGENPFILNLKYNITKHQPYICGLKYKKHIMNTVLAMSSFTSKYIH